MRFWSSMKAAVSARFADPARLSTTSRANSDPPPFCTMLRERPVDLGHDDRLPNRLDDLVERPPAGGSGCQLLDQRIPPANGLAAFDGWPSRTTGRKRRLPLAVGEGLVELHREGNGQGSRGHIPAVMMSTRMSFHSSVGISDRRGRSISASTRRDDLDPRHAWPAGQIGVDSGDQGGVFHGGSTDAEEALLGGTRRPGDGRPTWPDGSALPPHP